MGTVRVFVLLACVMGVAACDDDADIADLAVVHDLSAVPDLSRPCTQVLAWPGIGTAFFTPLAHDGKDVVTVRSNRSVTQGGDGGSRTDQLLIEIRNTPGQSVAYPRTVTLDASSGYGDCDTCVTVGSDVVAGTPKKLFLARSGTLQLSRVDQAKEGRIELMGGTLHLVEWAANDTAVTDGECYDVDKLGFAIDYSQGPVTTPTDM